MEKIITDAGARIDNINGLMYLMEPSIQRCTNINDKESASVLGTFFILWEELRLLSEEINELEDKAKGKTGSGKPAAQN